MMLFVSTNNNGIKLNLDGHLCLLQNHSFQVKSGKPLKKFSEKI